MNHIVHVQIENMLGLTEATIKPGEIVLLEGGNGAGKSGVIDSILAVFKSKGIEGDFVTKGAEKGRVFIKLADGHSIRASFSNDGKKSVAITTPDGDSKKAPQAWLDSLFGQSVVNPVSFLVLPTTEKRKILLSALPITVTQDNLQEWFGETLPVDTSKHGLEVCSDVEKLYYDRRKNANAGLKAKQSELSVVSKDIPDGFDAAEWESVDTSSLTQQLQDIGRIEAEKRALAGEATQISHNAGKSRQAAADSQTKVDSIKHDIEQLNARIAQLQEQIVAYDSLIVEETEEKGMQLVYAADLDAESAAKLAEAEAIEVPDKTVIEQKLNDYSQAQRVLKQIENRDRLQTEVELAQCDADLLDAKVNEARVRPQELLAQADFPVDGIEFTEADIKVNGLSIDSLSDGEKLKLGVAIAKATSGELGLICVDGAEVLDEENFEWLMAQADENHHFFISKVGQGELKISNVEPEKPAVDERQQTMFGEEQ